MHFLCLPFKFCHFSNYHDNRLIIQYLFMKWFFLKFRESIKSLCSKPQTCVTKHLENPIDIFIKIDGIFFFRFARVFVIYSQELSFVYFSFPF